MSLQKIPMELLMFLMPEKTRSRVAAIREQMNEMHEKHAARMEEMTESMKLKYGFRGPAMRLLIAALAKNTSLIKLMMQAADTDEFVGREITGLILDMVASSIACGSVMAQNLPLDTNLDELVDNKDEEIVAWAKMLFQEEMSFNLELHKVGIPLGEAVRDFIESKGGGIGG